MTGLRRAAWAIVLLVVSGGCFSPDIGAGLSCESGLCPPGLRCDQATRQCVANVGTNPDPRSYRAAVLADGPLLYLELEEPASQQALDSSGFERHGAYEGGASFDPDGAVGGAAYLDGVDDRIAVADDPALRLEGDYSIELWVRLGELVSEFPGVLRKGEALSGDTGFIIYLSNDGVPILKRAGLDELGAADEAFAMDRFRHFVLTYDSAEEMLSWYADGELVKTYVSITWPSNSDPSPLLLGRGDNFGNQWVDELALYDKVLTAAQVAAHFDAAAE